MSGAGTNANTDRIVRERLCTYVCSAVLDEGEPDRKNKRILSHIFFSDSSFFLRVDLMQSSGKNKE